jgi:endonuclease/exonuclease/phosphatase family metal-dependent hydrolase
VVLRCLSAVGCVLALALCGCERERPAFTLMQANLCLSGLAGCYDPAVVEETVARIRATRPDAVTVSEACREDVARIARRTGYHVRFTQVLYGGDRLRCVRPGNRGLFGVAVLSAAPVASAESRDFARQAGPGRRRWLCVTTPAGPEVCTAHLNTRSPVEIAGNDAQCAELAALLARRASARPVVFGGDVNRRGSCAPAGAWTRTDASASQARGLQHVYGTDALRSPEAEVLRAAHSDHDVLVVRARR